MQKIELLNKATGMKYVAQCAPNNDIIKVDLIKEIEGHDSVER